MKRKLILLASLVFVLCCLFAVSVSATCATCTDSWEVSLGSKGYLGEISAVNTCSVCGAAIKSETIPPLFETLGYSYNNTTGYGITQHYAVNRDALARYEEITGEAVRFGVVAAITADGTDPLDANGNSVGNAQAVDFTSKDYEVFDIYGKSNP